MKQSETRRRFFLSFVIGIAAIGVGCGNRGAPAATPESAKNEQERDGPDSDRRATQAPKGAAMPHDGNGESSASAASVQPTTTDKLSDEPRMAPEKLAAGKSAVAPSRAYREANRDLENALRTVGAIDCGLACKALASMTRAVTETCSLARETQEKNECTEEKKTLETAAVRVRNTCGACRDSR
ncbi:MAG: hypothetical protein KBF88_01195 [Polyangiaceae bacterium]|nr:hypothetical protein [Polyangiaceae bacterium]